MNPVDELLEIIGNVDDLARRSVREDVKRRLAEFKERHGVLMERQLVQEVMEGEEQDDLPFPEEHTPHETL